MNKKILVAAVGGLLVISGCQSIGDHLGKNIAKTLVEQSSGGKVKIDDLENGKIKVQTEDGTIEFSGDDKNQSMKVTDQNGKEIASAQGKDGNFSMTDADGRKFEQTGQNSSVIKNAEGNVEFETKNSPTRPEYAPVDLASVDGAHDFSYIRMKENISLMFAVAGQNAQTVCANEATLLTARGWVNSDAEGLSLNTAESTLNNYDKGNQALMVICNKDEEGVKVTLQQTTKQQ